MTLAETGHLDMAFVHPRVQGKGAAARLYDAVLDEAKARKLTRLFTEASLLFKPFLDPRGWHVLEAEIVHMDGVSLERFRMAIAL
jgi:putative acetyltransferase